MLLLELLLELLLLLLLLLLLYVFHHVLLQVREVPPPELRSKYIQQKQQQQQQFQQQLQQQLQQHQHLCLTAMQGSCMAGLIVSQVPYNAACSLLDGVKTALK